MRIEVPWLLAFAASVVACSEPLPPIRYETEKALIGTEFDERVCDYQLAAVDHQIRFVEDMLGAPSDEKIEIYVFSEPPDDCFGLGCYYYEQGIIKTIWPAIDHEVVHAVEARFVDEPRAFWSEGIAVALEPPGTHEGQSSVLDNIGQQDRRRLDYGTAGNFVRWLLETRDPTLIRSVLKGSSVDSVYGRSIEELAQAYDAEHPYAYPPWFPCDYPALPSPEAGLWTEEILVSCDHPEGTAGENYRYSVVRSVELPAGQYSLQTIGGSGTRMVGCQMDIWPEFPMPMVHGDIPNEVENSQTSPGALFRSGQKHLLNLTRDGTYKVVVATTAESESVRVEIQHLR